MPSITDLPGVPESVLPEALAARLPASTPAPPWHCRVRAVVWVQRTSAPLPDGSAYAGRALPLTLCALVHYLESPVGPYREVFAGPLLRGRPVAVHVPFVAVDSLPSVHGGRAHWSLPKAYAGFTGDVAAGVAQVTGDGWSVGVAARPVGPPLPVAGPLVSEQAGRRATVALRGLGRPARVTVAATGPSLGRWLGTGTHLGVVARGRMVVHPPG